MRHASRSHSAFTHADRDGALSRSAAAWYFAFSAGVTRMRMRSLAGSGTRGRPRGRLGLGSMAVIMGPQIIVDKLFPA